MTDNCVNWCAHVEQDGTCCGQCITTIKPKLETLNNDDLEHGASPLLIIKDDEIGK